MGIAPAQAIAPFEVKGSSFKERTFTGLGSTWDLDLGGDVIVRGAFEDSLAQWKASGLSIPLIDSHDYSNVVSARLGKMVDAHETEDGLWTTFKIFKTRAGDDLMAMLADDGIDGLSIGYEALQEQRPTDEAKAQGVRRVLSRVHLREISVVDWGMNPNALIAAGTLKRRPIQQPIRTVTASTSAGGLEPWERAERIRELQLRALGIGGRTY